MTLPNRILSLLLVLAIGSCGSVPADEPPPRAGENPTPPAGPPTQPVPGPVPAPNPAPAPDPVDGGRTCGTPSTPPDAGEPACYGLDEASCVSANANCGWLAPGCDPASLPGGPGCFQREKCRTNADCPADRICQSVSADPCRCTFGGNCQLTCDACGSETWACIPRRCAGAWLDENRTCRGLNDGALPTDCCQGMW